MIAVGITMVATNSYLERWKDAALAIERAKLATFKNVQIHLFTDRASDAVAWSKQNLHEINICAHSIPSYGWPEATLFRYRFFSQNLNHFEEDVLIYMDSDLLVTNDFSKVVSELCASRKMVFVGHPGFARRGPHGGPFSLNWLRRITWIERRITHNLEICQSKGVWNGTTLFLAGAWETSPSSKAFVPWSRRKQYFYGAIWFGEREKFLEMCLTLSRNVDLDLEDECIAIWHDESHLNWFAAHNKHSIAPKNFCLTDNNPKLGTVENYVVAVTKEDGEGRQPSIETLKAN